MIGVVVSADDRWVAEELFELFKTPWEVAVPDRRYAAIVSNGDVPGYLDAEAFIVYGSQPHAMDGSGSKAIERISGPSEVVWRGTTIPIYGGLALFAARGGVLKRNETTADCRYETGICPIHRIGYDLFAEVRYLLTTGQPVSRADTPTLDRHIEVLRHLLQDLGVSFLEIAPRPAGRDFICCLTHDIDFFGIRRHRFDRTLAGFAVRATLGSLVDCVRGRRPASEAIRNWAALLSVPFVFMRLMPDFWRPFEDYAGLENGRRSTFFLVPFKGKAGAGPDGRQSASRAVPYQVSEVRDQARDVAAVGNEIGVHGIDAWRDVAAGRAELTEVTEVSGRSTAGVRMHWLYFDPESPARLEQAGFEYDSTCGYNDAVGYRAGTSQVFRLPGTEAFLELPLSIMDSALFYPARMGLTRAEALRRCRAIVRHARRSGGTVVINWHDRSLAPERLWGEPYRQLLEYVGQDDRAWFATAGEAVDWFRWRRSIRFHTNADGTIRVTAPERQDSIPGARITVHRVSGGKRVPGELLLNREATVDLRPS